MISSKWRGRPLGGKPAVAVRADKGQYSGSSQFKRNVANLDISVNHRFSGPDRSGNHRPVIYPPAQVDESGEISVGTETPTASAETGLQIRPGGWS